MSAFRITMLAPFGIRPKGTLSARMLPLAQALVRRGHCVSIVAPPVQNPQDAGRRDVYAGVPVIHTPLPAGPASVASQVLSLVRATLSERPDVLHLFKPKGYSGLAALLLRALRPSLSLVLDTDDWEGWGGWNDLLPYPRSAKTLFAWQERDLPRRADSVTVASRTLQAQVWGFGVSPERVFYVPNGVARIENEKLRIEKAPEINARFSILNSQFSILLYTRFWEFDVRDLVAALVPVAAACPAARLLVVGRGERGEERELLRLAERAGVLWAIDYRGWAEPEQIPALLAAADLALAPMDDTLINRARSSAKLLELMAAGLPIVAGRVGEAAEYVEDGRSGMLVAPGDPAALARATLALLADAPLRERLGQGARARVAGHYTWDGLAPVAEHAYALARRLRSASA
jgi:glycosyltransferase involved in cell wall biosynthesis